MRLRPLLKPWPLAAIWTLLFLILMIVGFALLASPPSGNFNDVVAISDADVAAVALGLWLGRASKRIVLVAFSDLTHPNVADELQLLLLL
jgi:hypothetical protein